MDEQGYDFFFFKIDSDNDDIHSILIDFWKHRKKPKRKSQILLIEKSWVPDPNIDLFL